MGKKLEIFLLILGGFLSGFVGSLGVGGGGVLIVFLTFFMSMQREVAAITNLWFFIPIACFSVIIYLKRGQIDVKKSLLLASFGLIGSAIGVYLSGVIDTKILTKIFGAGLIFISVKTLFEKQKDHG